MATYGAESASAFASTATESASVQVEKAKHLAEIKYAERQIDQLKRDFGVEYESAGREDFDRLNIQCRSQVSSRLLY